ncbi:AAA family ATPase [Shewanella benthica]|uniref:Flp pilus assembly protein, ATPase CpaE n=1 Tax=Shewanella benthica KT99 TaxID=314608 RepID=A9EKE7_9GAMM|nr:pilus biosynthesis protein CpaE [Shewanella benthica]EDP99560.1 Flp pilus assembly protein, ATPase CpaE [Shewanella benthica KT99]
MDKPLELLVSNETARDTNKNINVDSHPAVKTLANRILPYPVHALLINSCHKSIADIELNLNSYLNLSWEGIETVNSFAASSTNARPYNLVLLVLPNDEASAVQALKSAAAYGVDIIILGQNTPQGVLRLAFQQGVSDFVSPQELAAELLQSLEKIAHKLADKADLAPVLAVVNAKGGSGASFIAASIAMITSIRDEGEVSLLDTDLLQGTLAHMLGLEPHYFITDAIQELDSLDEMALKGAMTNLGHLHLLAAEPFAVLNASEPIELRNTNELLLKCRQYYQQVVIDLSRGPEIWNVDMLTNANILLVMQQNVMSIREAKAVVNQLVRFMGIDIERIHLLINRYQKTSSGISLKDIRETTGIESHFVVANDFKLASQCTDLGSPITEVANREQILKDLSQVTEHFFPRSKQAVGRSQGFWNRILRKGL